MSRWLFSALLVIIPLSSFAATSAQCLGKAVWYEARGESATTQKAVWQVVRNRATISGQSVCQVVRKNNQFPWAKRVKSWKLSSEQLTLLFRAVNMRPVVNQKVIYFNTRKHNWGKRTRKIGRLYFSE